MTAVSLFLGRVVTRLLVFMGVPPSARPQLAAMLPAGWLKGIGRGCRPLPYFLLLVGFHLFNSKHRRDVIACVISLIVFILITSLIKGIVN